MGSRLGSAVLVAAVTASLLVVSASPASAAGTALFTQPFTDNAIVPGGGEVVLPAKPWGDPNDACLTTTGSSSPAPLQSCWYANDNAPNGVLSLNTTIGSQLGGVFAATSVPATQGLDLSFDTYQWGGNGADGISFVLAAVDPTHPLPPANLGQPGGALGYAAAGGSIGFANGYLGIGFDAYGAYSSDGLAGADCDPNLPFLNAGPGQVTVRGPGNGTAGYCGLAGTGDSGSGPLNLRSGDRASSRVPVEIVINPTAGNQALTTHTVAPGDYGIVFTPIGDSEHYVTGSLPVVPDGLYTSDSWLANGIPKQLAFGWVGSTGSLWDNHEISNVTVESLNPVPVLTVAQTAYSPASPTLGDPVTYVIQPGVSATGANETEPIAVTTTVPNGITPVGGTGDGWVCADPVGQNVTCTYSDVPIPAGTALPPITMSGVVTQEGLSGSDIRSATVTTVASEDANPGFSTGADPGVPSTAPSDVTIAPTLGSIDGGGSATITGTDVVGATVVRVGTTDEILSGTGATLLPCVDGPLVPCFSDIGDGTLIVSAMPAHARGEVTVQVATLGAAGSGSYAYVEAPSAPLAPSAEAGPQSATVTFDPPSDDGGTPVTSYTVTPYDGALAGTPVSSATSPVIVTSLTPGTAYTFRVTATNAIGTSTEAITSPAVIPFTIPDAPTIDSVTAGSSSATVEFSPPAGDGFSPITSYAVVPFIGSTAQTPWTTGSSSPITVNDLIPGTSYTFKVIAINTVGGSPMSAPSSAVTPYTVPGAPTIDSVTAGTESVSVAFSAPASDGFQPITDYTITPYVGTTAGTPVHTSVSPVTVGSLTAGVVYTFRVTATNIAGDSAESDPSSAVTPYTNPDAPSITSVTAGSSAVTVAFAPAGDGFANITGYTITPYIGSTAGTPVSASGSSTSVNVTGLIPGTAYTFRVTATNIAGDSAESGPSSTVVPYTTPGAPTITSVTAGTESATIAWSPGATGFNPIDAYSVTPYLDGVAQFGGGPAFSSPITMHGLLGGRTYTFVVRALNDAGWGTPSSPSSAIVVHVRPIVVLHAPPGADVNTPYSDTFSGAGGTLPYSWSVHAGSLPAGLVLHPSTGAITGTPTHVGVTTFTIRVTDANAVFAQRVVSMTVAPRPTLVVALPAPGSAGRVFDWTLAPSGGTAPYTWSVSAGHLPPGYSLAHTTGRITGTTYNSGTYRFTITVTDAHGVSASHEFVVVIRNGALNSRTIAATPNGNGYWLVTRAGEVDAFGSAQSYGDVTSEPAHPVVGITSTSSGKGYWLVTSGGHVYTFGDAKAMGSAPTALRAPIVGMTMTLSGKGYWLVASDGGVFSFGDAKFHGSTGAMSLNQPIVGMAATPTGRGYWLVAADGGIFSFGDATFHGSTGAMKLNQPVVGMAGTVSGRGYRLVAADGGIFSFGDATFHGSTGALALVSPISGIAATPAGRGYWIVATDGAVYAFGDAKFYGSRPGAHVAHR